MSTSNPSEPLEAASKEDDPPPLSKNKLKRLKRDQEWEASRDQRKALRKEKQQAKKLRKRTAREEASLQASATPSTMQGEDAEAGAERRRRHHQPPPIQVPVAIVIDCGFDDLMRDTEIMSLGAQITRSYSDNNRAPCKSHLIISSFGGRLKERFDTVLEGHHRSWKGVRFLDEDFIEAARQAERHMGFPGGGRVAGALLPQSSDEPAPVASDASQAGEVVYLTSDSPHTLSTLSPNSTYIVGGIVDKNRHKGICYKRAMDREIKTAKLPVGDYLQMSTRAVLTTNHVVEIMLRWLECGDWGEAFMQVIPQRKGGRLRKGMSGTGEGTDEVADLISGEGGVEKDGDAANGKDEGAASGELGAETIGGKADYPMVEGTQVTDDAPDTHGAMAEQGTTETTGPWRRAVRQRR